MIEVTSRGHKQLQAELRAEARKMVSTANKRIRRLEKNGLQNSPAYQTYIRQGGKPFSVKGKDYNEVQKEMAKMRQFMKSITSTVRGYNATLKGIANSTGIKYKNIKQLQSKATAFFKLSSIVEQHLNNLYGSASAIGYQAIWDSINNYVQQQKVDLESLEDITENMVQTITGMSLEQYEHEQLKQFTKEINGKWYEF